MKFDAAGHIMVWDFIPRAGPGFLVSVTGSLDDPVS